MPIATEKETDATPSRAKAGQDLSPALRFRRRMLEWANPVEFVNNMYGSHPGEDRIGYFSAIYRK